jgi:hypothetical protein
VHEKSVQSVPGIRTSNLPQTSDFEALVIYLLFRSIRRAIFLLIVPWQWLGIDYDDNDKGQVWSPTQSGTDQGKPSSYIVVANGFQNLGDAISSIRRGGYAISGLAQILAHLAGVQSARRGSGKVNCDVFWHYN